MMMAESSPKLTKPTIDLASPTIDGHPFSPSLSSSSTPSISVVMSPSGMPTFMANGGTLLQSPYQKFSIHHQDAEVSIADATDCLRMVSGKVNWFYRKQAFCPHLMSADDVEQIAALHQKILIEEVPFLELQIRLQEGVGVDIPRELQGRVQVVCGLIDELKRRIDDLITNITPMLLAQH